MTQATIEAIHAAPLRLSLCVAGAGAAAVSALTSVAGCSRTLMHAEVLYARAATVRALDYNPAHVVSQTVARQLAQYACRRAQQLSNEEDAQQQHQQQQHDGVSGHNSMRTAPHAWRNGTAAPVTPVVGVGATSAVHTSRQRHGADEVYVSLWRAHARRVRDYHVVLPTHWTRTRQDDAVTALILHAIAHEAAAAAAATATATRQQAPHADCGVLASAPLCRVLDLPSDAVCCTSDTPLRPVAHDNDDEDEDDEALVQRVLDGQLRGVVWNRYGDVRAADTPYGDECTHDDNDNDSTTTTTTSPPRLLYPGSFRPLHWGHRELARAAAAAVCAARHRTQHCDGSDRSDDVPPYTASDVQVTYEMAASIVDKGHASARELCRRVRQFVTHGERVAVTSATLFVQKAALFPRHGFVVGLDTARRVLEPRYYTPSTTAGMVAALLRDVGSRGCYFVVGGRCADSSGSGAAAAAWHDLTSLNVPDELRHLFIGLSEQQFRVDVSSTELRARAAAHGPS